MGDDFEVVEQPVPRDAVRYVKTHDSDGSPKGLIDPEEHRVAAHQFAAARVGLDPKRLKCRKCGKTLAAEDAYLVADWPSLGPDVPWDSQEIVALAAFCEPRHRPAGHELPKG